MISESMSYMTLLMSYIEVLLLGVRPTEVRTPELADEIRSYANKNPRLHQRDIAQRFNVNPGRVSEALNHLI